MGLKISPGLQDQAWNTSSGADQTSNQKVVGYSQNYPDSVARMSTSEYQWIVAISSAGSYH